MAQPACRAVCFDLDGTLLDTVQDLAAALNAVLAQRGFPSHSLDDYKGFVGEGAALLVERALPESVRHGDMVTACLTEFRDAYGRAWNVHSRLYEGIAVLLDGLVDRGIRLAMLSNKPHRYTVQCAEHYFSQWPFEAVYGQLEDIPKKPDPAGAFRIAGDLGIAPKHFLFVGDSGVDMQTALAAGMAPIGVSWGYRPVEELQSAGAQFRIDTPTALLEIVDRA